MRHHNGMRELGTTAVERTRGLEDSSRPIQDGDLRTGRPEEERKQHQPEGLGKPLRNRHTGKAASGEEEEAPKRIPKAGQVR